MGIWVGKRFPWEIETSGLGYTWLWCPNLHYVQDDTTLIAESEEELKSLLMKEESEKSWLKAQHS